MSQMPDLELASSTQEKPIMKYTPQQCQKITDFHRINPDAWRDLKRNPQDRSTRFPAVAALATECKHPIDSVALMIIQCHDLDAMLLNCPNNNQASLMLRQVWFADTVKRALAVLEKTPSGRQSNEGCGPEEED
jgi:hypothetical protein